MGSLEARTDGEVASFDGDRFEYTMHANCVVINGRVVCDTPA